MSCHPSHQKPSKLDPRAVRRQHRWKHGHDPQDPDADPASGWLYANLEQHDGSPPDQRHLLTGGPESGLPCVECGEMTHIAGSKTAKEIMEQPEVEVSNRATMNDADWERLDNDVILILACPKCDHLVQMRKEFVPRFRGA